MTVPLWVCFGLVLIAVYITHAVLIVCRAEEEPEAVRELAALKIMHNLQETEIKSLQDQIEGFRIMQAANARSVAKSNEAQVKLDKLWLEYCKLDEKYNVLLARPVQTVGAAQFSQEEIKRLIRLCHPDKHNGSEAAHSITQKLLEMRK